MGHPGGFDPEKDPLSKSETDRLADNRLKPVSSQPVALPEIPKDVVIRDTILVSFQEIVRAHMAGTPYRIFAWHDDCDIAEVWL